MNIHASDRWKPLLATLAALVAILATGLPAAAQNRETRFEGTIYDGDGEPVPGCRVLTRVADGADVYISPPSDESGRYWVAVPSGQSYVFVALVAPTGGRVALPESPLLLAVPGSIDRDITIPGPAPPRPREGLKDLAGVDRLFLGFVEAPAIVTGPYVEMQVDAASSDLLDTTTGRLVAAFSFGNPSRIEFGLRGGFAEVESDGLDSESGATDLEVWGKFHFFRSTDNRWDLAAGGLMTLPTGNRDAGLPRDALQSKLFLAAGYALRSATILFNVGVRTTEDAEVVGPTGGTSLLDGQASFSGGIGVLAALSDRSSVVFEISHDGERFDNAESDTRALVGFNRRVHSRGLFRFAVAAGLEDDIPPDAELILGYALTF